MSKLQSNEHLLHPDVMAWHFQLDDGVNIAGLHRQGIESAPRIHFLHGNGFCASTLLQLASHLPSEWHCWFTDIPGHGRSDQPHHRMPNWQAMAADVAQALAQNANVAQQGPVIGVGHSMGAVMTLLAAAKQPHLFSRIILLDPVLFAPEILWAQSLLRTTGIWKRSALVKAVRNRRSTWTDTDAAMADLARKKLYRNWHPHVLEDFVTSGTHTVEEGIQLSCHPHWEASIFGSYPKGLWRAVRKLSIPVDILMAENSYGFIPRSVRKACRVNSFIRGHYFGGSHCFPMEKPKQTAEMINRLLSNDSSRECL